MGITNPQLKASAFGNADEREGQGRFAYLSLHHALGQLIYHYRKNLLPSLVRPKRLKGKAKRARGPGL